MIDQSEVYSFCCKMYLSNIGESNQKKQREGNEDGAVRT